MKRKPLHIEIKERGGDAIHLNWASRIKNVVENLETALELMDIGEHGTANNMIYAALFSLGVHHELKDD